MSFSCLGLNGHTTLVPSLVLFYELYGAFWGHRHQSVETLKPSINVIDAPRIIEGVSRIDVTVSGPPSGILSEEEKFVLGGGFTPQSPCASFYSMHKVIEGQLLVQQRRT